MNALVPGTWETDVRLTLPACVLPLPLPIVPLPSSSHISSADADPSYERLPLGHERRRRGQRVEASPRETPLVHAGRLHARGGNVGRREPQFQV